MGRRLIRKGFPETAAAAADDDVASVRLSRSLKGLLHAAGIPAVATEGLEGRGGGRYPPVSGARSAVLEGAGNDRRGRAPVGLGEVVVGHQSGGAAAALGRGGGIDGVPVGGVDPRLNRRAPVDGIRLHEATATQVRAGGVGFHSPVAASDGSPVAGGRPSHGLRVAGGPHRVDRRSPGAAASGSSAGADVGALLLSHAGVHVHAPGAGGRLSAVDEQERIVRLDGRPPDLLALLSLLVLLPLVAPSVSLLLGLGLVLGEEGVDPRFEGGTTRVHDSHLEVRLDGRQVVDGGQGVLGQKIGGHRVDHRAEGRVHRGDLEGYSSILFVVAVVVVVGVAVLVPESVVDLDARLGGGSGVAAPEHAAESAAALLPLERDLDLAGGRIGRVQLKGL